MYQKPDPDNQVFDTIVLLPLEEGIYRGIKQQMIHHKHFNAWCALSCLTATDVYVVAAVHQKPDVGLRDVRLLTKRV